MKYLYALVLAFITSASFGQFKMIKNILAPTTPDAGSIRTELSPNWVLFKGKWYFAASSDLVYGSELFRTDGTPGGTELLADTKPGMWASATPAMITSAGDKLFYVGDARSDGYELWVSDGTATGTRLVENAQVQKFYYGSSNMVGHNGLAYFTGFDQEHGYEVWVSDGTEGGTRMVKDVTAGMGVNTLTPIIYATNNIVFFAALNSSSNNYELWTTDGTEAGTVKLGVSMQYKPLFVSVGDNIYFFNGKDLWKSNGTTAGTVIVKTYTDQIDVYNISSFNDLIFYSGTFGAGPKLYRSDGTSAGTFAIADMEPELNTGIEYKGKGYFTQGSSIWRTDGTAVGTQKVNTPVGFPTLGGWAVLNDKLVMLARYPANNETWQALWTYDETNGFVKTTVQLHISAPDNYIKLPVLNNKIVFYNDDKVHGTEPSTITESGVTMIANINKAMAYQYYPTDITEVGNEIMFAINDTDHGYELWKTNGTEEGTTIVKDIVPGPQSPSLDNLQTKKNLLFFTAADGQPGGSYWRSDGTVGGTFKIGNLPPLYSTPDGVIPSSPVINNFVYFGAQGDLYKTDGTDAGTTKVKDDATPSTNFATIGNNFVFIDYNKNLWKSDGTDAGTTTILNMGAAFPSELSQGYSFTQAADQAFILASGISSYPLFRTDGTSGGTKLITHISNTSGNGRIIFGALNNVIYYRADDATHGFEIWRSDGTEAGTRMLKDLNPGSESSVPTWVYSDDNAIYLRTYFNDAGSLWKIDVSGNVTLVANIPVDISSPTTMVDGKLYFTSTLGGGELYRTDGTEKGTQSMGEIVKGTGRSMWGAYKAGSKLVLLAGDVDHGIGLWTTDDTYVPKTYQWITFNAIGNKTSTDKTVVLTATASSGLPVSFELVSGPATLSGATLTLTGLGTVVVKAKQAGNETYDAAIESLQSFDVGPAGAVTGLEDESVSITVSPNPATTSVLISGSSQFIITDMLGREVINMSSSNKETIVEVGHLPRGMYVVTLKTSSNANVSRKMVLK